MSGGKSTVGVIKQLALWEVGGEAPLSPPGYGIGVKTPAAVAEGMALHVMETHGDGSLKEGALGVRQPGLETGCGPDGDALVVLEERGPVIEWDSAPKGPKRGRSGGAMKL
jgi:hypothetical protein